MTIIATFVLGSWFGMGIIALARMASDDWATPKPQPTKRISLRTRRGSRVVLEADGSRRFA